MSTHSLKALALVGVGLAAGIAVANLPSARAVGTSAPIDMSQRRFMVSIDEVKQNVVFAEEFAGSYKRTVEMSDGSVRTIELTPMVHDGMQVVEFKDTGGHTYMGLNGTTTNGKLMVQLRDVAEMHAQLREQGWPAAGTDDH